MKYISLLIFALLPLFKIFGQEIYRLDNNYLSLSIHNENTKSKLSTIKITIRAIEDILILNNDGCFKLDSATAYFRNTFCPDYIITSVIVSNYLLINKGDTLSFISDNLNDSEIKAIHTNFVYIPTTTHEFIEQKKSMKIIQNKNGKEVYSVSQDIESKLIQSVKFVINKW